MATTDQEQPSPALLRTFFAGAHAALAFLTRIPCGQRPVSADALAWAPAWFPAVGCLLGLAGSLLLAGLAGAGSMVASVAVVGFLALVTGAFHEDGLADSADALGGAFTRPRLFAILKDSRIGSFGATALIVVLLLRITALAALGPLAPAGLILGQTVSRATPAWLMSVLPYVSPPGTARSAKAVSRGAGPVFVASLLASAVTAALVFGHHLALRQALLATSVSLLVTVVCGWRFWARAGGITGDFLGATQQLTDAAILVALAASR